MAIDHHTTTLESLQQQIDDMALILMHIRPDLVARKRVSDVVMNEIDEEQARQCMLAWAILLEYLSTQFLPDHVKVAYDHVRKGLNYDG